MFEFLFCWNSSSFDCKDKVIRDISAEGPPVPIPNTEVKLCWGDNTCLETSREDSSLRIQKTQRVWASRTTRRVGISIAEGPPVPIPNTEVKLCWGNNTCLETSREDSSLPTPSDTANKHTPVSCIGLYTSSGRTWLRILFLLSSVGRAPDC